MARSKKVMPDRPEIVQIWATMPSMPGITPIQRMRAAEILQGPVHLRHGAPAALSYPLRLVGIGNLLAWGLREERHVALPLWSGHCAEALAILVRHRLRGGKALVLQMVEDVELVPDILQRAPAHAVGSKPVGTPFCRPDPVGVIEAARVETALADFTDREARQHLVDQCSRRKD